MTDAPTAGVVVDSNVLLDLFTDDPVWAAWSEARLAEAFDAGHVVINPIGRALLTRDATGYRTLLPKLALISP